MTDYTERLRRLVDQPDVLQRLDEPVRLASGGWSRVFIDAKLAVVGPEGFRLAGEAMTAAAADAGAAFDAVGGLVLGAAPFAFAVAVSAGCAWFLARKEPKGRGTNRWIEGARLGPGHRVMLVDDVVTTGGSIRQAYERVLEAGAEVSFATTLVDRGEETARFFAGIGVAYRPMLTYRELGIDPVEPVASGPEEPAGSNSTSSDSTE